MSRISNIIILLGAGLTTYCHAQESWEKRVLTEREEINLFVISEMYGFARHFYPNPQNDRIDWTKFLMYAIEKAETVTDDVELLNVLEELFIPLIPDALFKKDSQPVHFQRKKASNGCYVRSHYPPGRYLRLQDQWNGAGNGIIHYVKTFENYMPTPDSMYCYLLKDGLYVFFPIAVSKLPQKTRHNKQIIKETSQIDLRLMPGNPFVNMLFRKKKMETARYDIPYYKKTSYRLAKIIKLHHQIRHFYPYYLEDGLDTKWDAACTDALNAAASCDNQFDFFEVTSRLIANVKDSHIWMSFIIELITPRIFVYGLPQFFPDAEFAFIGESLYIKTPGSSLSDKIEKWDRVITVNDDPFEQWLESRLTMISASTRQSALKKLTHRIFQTVGYPSEFSLTLESMSGVKKTVEVPTIPRYPNQTIDYPFIAKEMGDGVWHVNLNHSAGKMGTKYRDFSNYIPQLKNAEGIIFDVRGGPQLYSLSVLAHLIDSVISVGHLLASDYFFPNQENAFYRKEKYSTWYIAPATDSYSKREIKKMGGYEKPLKEKFNCPVVFLTDASIVSFGETFMEMVKHYQIGTIIGEPTAGTNGDVRFDLEEFMTGVKFTNHDDSQHHGIGVIPDITVRQEVGKDNMLEYAKSYIHKKTNK